MASLSLLSQGCGGCGRSHFLGLELKHNWGLDVICSLTETVSVVSRPNALFPRLFNADQNLTVLKA